MTFTVDWALNNNYLSHPLTFVQHLKGLLCRLDLHLHTVVNVHVVLAVRPQNLGLREPEREQAFKRKDQPGVATAEVGEA